MSVSASEFVLLGECLSLLKNPQVCKGSLYVEETGKFFSLLERTGLASTRQVAESLAGRDVPIYVDGLIATEACKQFSSTVDPISRRLYQELDTRDYIECDPVIPKCLRSSEFGNANSLEPYQEALRADVETCLRARLYRPAIVSAWSFGFDLLRKWVFSGAPRLAEFNSLLTKRTENSKRGSRIISNYEDFFGESELFVLEICRDAQGALEDFTTKTFRSLNSLLDDRNSFAHGNFHLATEHEAKSYVDRMVRIITNSPFS